MPIVFYDGAAEWTVGEKLRDRIETGGNNIYVQGRSWKEGYA